MLSGRKLLTFLVKAAAFVFSWSASDRPISSSSATSPGSSVDSLRETTLPDAWTPASVRAAREKETWASKGKSGLNVLFTWKSVRTHLVGILSVVLRNCSSLQAHTRESTLRLEEKQMTKRSAHLDKRLEDCTLNRLCGRPLLAARTQRANFVKRPNRQAGIGRLTTASRCILSR